MFHASAFCVMYLNHIYSASCIWRKSESTRPVRCQPPAFSFIFILFSLPLFFRSIWFDPSYSFRRFFDSLLFFLFLFLFLFLIFLFFCSLLLYLLSLLSFAWTDWFSFFRGDSYYVESNRLLFFHSSFLSSFSSSFLLLSFLFFFFFFSIFSFSLISVYFLFIYRIGIQVSFRIAFHSWLCLLFSVHDSVLISYLCLSLILSTFNALYYSYSFVLPFYVLIICFLCLSFSFSFILSWILLYCWYGVWIEWN